MKTFGVDCGNTSLNPSIPDFYRFVTTGSAEQMWVGFIPAKSVDTHGVCNKCLLLELYTQEDKILGISMANDVSAYLNLANGLYSCSPSVRYQDQICRSSCHKIRTLIAGLLDSNQRCALRPNGLEMFWCHCAFENETSVLHIHPSQSFWMQSEWRKNQVST